MPLGRGAGGRVRAGKLRSLAQRRRDRLLVEWVDEDSRPSGHEFRRASDLRGDDRPAAGHPFEHRLAERLDQARLADDIRVGDQRRYPVIRDGSQHVNVLPAFELGA
jgi:hypothetical protein